MPFRVVDLTRVPKVTEDERVTGILLTMKAVSYTHLKENHRKDGADKPARHEKEEKNQ